MSIFSRLFGPPKPRLDSVIEIVGDIAKTARSIAEYRKRLAEAAKAGDLDDAYSVFVGANRRAKEFIDRG